MGRSAARVAARMLTACLAAVSVATSGSEETKSGSPASDVRSPLVSPPGRLTESLSIGLFPGIDASYAWYSRFATPDDYAFDETRDKSKLTLMFFREKCKAAGFCYVSETNKIRRFSMSEFGTKGIGPQELNDTDAIRLDALLGSLPPEPPLPPKPRRVLVSVPDGESWRTRIYDRANMPQEIIELSIITGRSVPTFVLSFEPQAIIESNKFDDGAMALSPDGRSLASGVRYGDLRVFDPATREELVSTRILSELALQKLLFSPDGKYLVGIESTSLRVLTTGDWDRVAQHGFRHIDPTGVSFFTANG